MTEDIENGNGELEPPEDLRPSRTTPNFVLPVPGDAGPADYVTDTGNLADRLDLVLRQRQGRPLQIDRSNGLIEQLPHDSDDGDRIWVNLNGPVFATPSFIANFTRWEFMYVAAARAWLFAGGAPLRVIDPNMRGLFVGTGRWELHGPWCFPPFPGMWAHITLGARLTGVNGTVFAAIATAGADVYGAGSTAGGLEVGVSSGVIYATAANTAHPSFPIDPSQWLGLWAGAAAGTAYRVDFPWMSILPDFLFPAAARAAEGEGGQWPPPAPTPASPLDPSEYPSDLPPMPPPAEGPAFVPPPVDLRTIGGDQ